MNVTDLVVKKYLLLLCIIVCTGSYAQNHGTPLQKKILIKEHDLSVEALCNRITSQTGLVFSFNSQKITLRRQIHLTRPSYPVEELLALIQKTIGADYHFYKEHIIFRHQQQQPNLAAHKPVQKKSARRAPVPAQLPPVSALATVPPTPLPASLYTYDAATASPERTAVDASPEMITTTGDLTKTTIISASKITYRPPQPAAVAVAPATAKNTSAGYKPVWYTQAGIAANDVFYLNTFIKAGLPFIHGIVQWGSNFSLSGFRYGLGSSFPIKNNWRIHFEITAGNLSRKVPLTIADVLPDTTGTGSPPGQLTVRSQLFQLGLFAEKKINDHLQLSIGIMPDYLKNTYYLNDIETALQTAAPRVKDPENRFYTIKPAYTISHSFNPTKPVSSSTWIGFQLGLCYKF
jgi:hypothetical protein